LTFIETVTKSDGGLDYSAKPTSKPATLAPSMDKARLQKSNGQRFIDLLSQQADISTVTHVLPQNVKRLKEKARRKGLFPESPFNLAMAESSLNCAMAPLNPPIGPSLAK
jgi:hypothetical protein